MPKKRDVVLKVEDLVVRYRVGRRRVNAVNGVSFELERGSMLGIVGESGCGKSATAHAIARLLPKNGAIEGGYVDFDEREGERLCLSELPARSEELRELRGKSVSMIFQDPLSSLNPVYTVGRQISEALLAHEKMPREKAKERVVKLLERLGIPEPLKRYNDYPHQFSGGMKQRVMIAIAMICDPAVLIADEPTTALDVTIQAQIIDLMRELQRERGTSIILITHNMGLVAECCDEVAVMYMGRIVEKGPIERIFGNPLHPYTSALLRSVPVLGMKRRELESIPGGTPDASEAIEGCAFCERCSKAFGECAGALPAEIEAEPGHFVCCHLYREEGASE
ncbi:MAG: ABC transporter ATP-binding protein [Oscillospiraceae bacterium]|nr:ABC transporter ATP-binding protein [Oscillospiraceae bacterium]